tara:strand:- start:379 stop:645 length:267 start_codon:yes stop_codon:yes gene_type:complete
VKQGEKWLLFTWICFLIWLYLIITSFYACSNGWSVANIEVTPSDSIDISYLIIVDQDSVSHWYEYDIEMGDNYCYKHHIWEDVRKKSE